MRWEALSRSCSDGALVVKDADDGYNEVCVLLEKDQRSYSDADVAAVRRAKLIAAAPELLDACETILRAIEWRTTADRLNTNQQAQILRAAIAKATA